MTARKGFAPVQVAVLISLIIIVGFVGFRTFRQTGQIADDNTTDASPVEAGGDEPQQPQPQIYTVEEMTIIESENPYYKGALIRGMDDESKGDVSDWNINSDLQIDYDKGRLWFTSWTRKKTYGIFQVDESGGRAVLVIEYQTGGYPTGFSDDALTYAERSYIPRRMDAVLLGVRDEQ